ncbi:hypothetical protein SBA1_550103 [Candidatus Sulfotelmatobacter kueseliae]|uniref:Uncharacterized protein n=1 Tax=Candidatus Sulfotelmatobacter kueseliae TaxID=2042962 RepID=A0A2U3KYM2_9BACT|nr:hypothetical protein SBA1_550103 [Candidatus Sulfotelmatobacter kueseliae]
MQFLEKSGGNNLCRTKTQNASASGNKNIANNGTRGGERSAQTQGRDSRVFQKQRPTWRLRCTLKFGSERPTLFQIRSLRAHG